MTDETTITRFGPEPASAGIRVLDAMHDGVLTCSRHTSLAEVASLMSRRRVHCVVVTEADDDAVWGIVSDLDLAAAAGVRDLEEQTAGATAATIALTIGPDETLQRAAQLMTEHATTHLLVVGEGRPVGVISTLDVAAALAPR